MVSSVNNLFSLDWIPFSKKTGSTSWEEVYQQKLSDFQKRKERWAPTIRPGVVVLGAGPAGLIRAIKAIEQSSPVTLIEKRRAEQPGRAHTVRLESCTIDYLQEIGVIAYLCKEGLIHYREGDETCNVRLIDLEKALREVFYQVSSPKDQMIYGHRMEKIDFDPEGKAILTLVDEGNQSEHMLPPTDVLVVAEGARSSTCEKLGFRRIQVFPPSTVVTALFEDKKLDEKEQYDLLSQVKRRIRDFQTQMDYFFEFIKQLWQGENIFNPERNIIAGVVLNTPGQNYMGIQFSERFTDEVKALYHEIQSLEEQIKKISQQKDNIEEFVLLEAKRQEKQDLLQEKLVYWVHVAFFFSHALQISMFFWGQKSFSDIISSLCRWRPLQERKITVVDTTVDKLDHFSEEMQNTSVLICGDAAGTVDPATGQGVNMALVTARYFQKFLGYKRYPEIQEENHHQYQLSMKESMDRAHLQVGEVRQFLNPKDPFTLTALPLKIF